MPVKKRKSQRSAISTQESKSHNLQSKIRRSAIRNSRQENPKSEIRNPQFEDPQSEIRNPQLAGFAADVMLGRLARWLRASGVDVYYDNAASDDQLVQLFLNEKRWIITRDRGLVKRRVLQGVIFIESETLEDQLREFFEKTKFILDRNQLRPFSRCVECNHDLISLSSEEARPRVPPYVFQHHEVFKICPSCDKIFWAGTHRNRIEAFLKKACLF